MTKRAIAAVLAALLAAPLLAFATGSAPGDAARVDVTIDEWTAPWEKSLPRDPYVDGSGQSGLVQLSFDEKLRNENRSEVRGRYEDAGTRTVPETRMAG